MPDLTVVNFVSIGNRNFPEIPDKTVQDLSTDQSYAYRICRAIISGCVDDNLSKLKVGPLAHSCWLTLGCRVFRLYTSKQKPSSKLCLLASFCILVYFPAFSYKISL